MVALALLARLLIVALVGRIVARLMITLVMIALAVAHERRLLRLRNEARLLAEVGEILTVVLAVVAAADGLVAAGLLVLAELLLGCRDQAEIVLGVLVVVLGGDRVARGARIAGKLEIFFRDVRGRAADLDVGSV